MYTSLLITVAGVLEASALKVPPQMRSMQFVGVSVVLPAFVAHGIMSQSSLQELETIDDTAFCPCVLPERVNACVRLFTERQHT